MHHEAEALRFISNRGLLNTAQVRGQPTAFLFVGGMLLATAQCPHQDRGSLDPLESEGISVGVAPYEPSSEPPPLVYRSHPKMSNGRFGNIVI